MVFMTAVGSKDRIQALAATINANLGAMRRKSFARCFAVPVENSDVAQKAAVATAWAPLSGGVEVSFKQSALLELRTARKLGAPGALHFLCIYVEPNPAAGFDRAELTVPGASEKGKGKGSRAAVAAAKWQEETGVSAAGWGVHEGDQTIFFVL